MPRKVHDHDSRVVTPRLHFVHLQNFPKRSTYIPYDLQHNVAPDSTPHKADRTGLDLFVTYKVGFASILSASLLSTST